MSIDVVKLNTKERSEITRKVRAFRVMITNAAIKRKQKKPPMPRRILSKDQKIEILQRWIQGEKIKDLAKTFDRNAAYLSQVVDRFICDQLIYEGRMDDEWHRCLYGNNKEKQEVWGPLALQRLKENMHHEISTQA